MTISRLLAFLILVSRSACKLGEFDDIASAGAEPATRPVPRPVSTGPADATPPSARAGSAAALESPDSLIGLDEQDALSKLGEPDSIDRQSQAHLWHYRMRPSCELVLYFYVDMTTRTRHVLAYENRPVEGGPGCSPSRTAKRG